MAFNGFTAEFSNTPVSTTFPSYLPLNLTEDVNLYWAFIAPYQPTPFSQVIQVITNTSDLNSIYMPDATYTSVGQSCYFINSSATNFNIYGQAGDLIVTIDAGTVWWLTLIDNSTADGSWIFSQLGGTVTPIPITTLVDNQDNTISGLPMYGGLAVITDTQVPIPGTYLKTNMWVQDYNHVGPYNQSMADRGSLLQLTSTSTVTYNLLSAATAGNGFIFSLNAGAGAFSLIPNGSDSIDIDQLNPGNSVSFISNGINAWSSLGFGLNTIPSNFTDITLSLAPGSVTQPPLSFYNDPTSSLGLFYNQSNNSMEIVQSYPISPLTPVILAQFYANATYPGGLVTLATQSTFNNNVVNISPFVSFNLTTPSCAITGNEFNVTVTTAVNLKTPIIEQNGMSIYSLTMAYE